MTRKEDKTGNTLPRWLIRAARVIAHLPIVVGVGCMLLFSPWWVPALVAAAVAWVVAVVVAFEDHWG